VKFKRQRRDTLAVNLTPLIDVVFLLLIFFMVSTSFTDLSELVVNLPEAEGETLEPDKGLDIIITADGAMFLNALPFPQTRKIYVRLSLKKPAVDAIYLYLSSQTVTRGML